MMWFDVQAALAEVEEETTEAPSRVAHVARVARPQPAKSGNPSSGAARHEAAVLDAIESGRLRPGAIASATGLGATVTYELLDRLLAKGRLVMALDGEITLAHSGDC